MNRWFQATFLVIFLASSAAFLPLAAPAPARAEAGVQPNPPTPPQNPVFLPLTLSHQVTYTISGQVTDDQATPLAVATIVDSLGRSVATGADGTYSLSIPQGEYALAASLDGYSFDPSEVDVSVHSDLINQDFHATAACKEALQNGDFESTAWWSLQAGEIPASYSTSAAHSGLRSAFTGLTDPGHNVFGYSFVRSPLIAIPAGSTAVTLRAWFYMLSTEATAAPTTKPEEGQTALPEAPMTYDAQFVQVLDSNNQLIGTPMWVRYNNGFWTFQIFDLSAYAGRSIKLQIGSYNDGSDGVTALYVDGLSMQICGGTPPPPPPSGSCSNQIANSGFEYNGAWGIPNTDFPAAYTADYAYSGSRSLRTGIPLYSYANRYSYSDAWQTVYIPANAASAKLRMQLLPRSEETYAPSPVQSPPEAGAQWGLAPLAGDAQYVLVLNPNTGAILETLLWWTPKNSPTWISKEFDLSGYAGRSVRIQFGSYNDGFGGRSVMYTDDVTVDTCSGTPPPPPSGCTERVGNGGFEASSAWYIPLTAFSAGYSTALAHSGYRSMRSGILYQAHNRYSYSDFRQSVSIPALSSSAVLTNWLYLTSGETGYLPDVTRPTAPEFGLQASSGDVQYLLVLDQWGSWLDTLVWRRSNEQYWQKYQFDLRRFAGQSIILQWGTYNNGYNGVTSMFVDDVSLIACR